MGGDGQDSGCDSGFDGSDIGSNYIGGFSGVVVGGETGSGKDGSGNSFWIRVTAALEVVSVASPLPGALATAAIAVMRVGQVLLRCCC